MESPLSRLMAALDAARPRHPLEAEGWKYLDLPARFAPDIWDFMLEVMGPENHQVLATTQGTLPSGKPYVRGQLMVSPTGMRNMNEWAKGSPTVN